MARQQDAKPGRVRSGTIARLHGAPRLLVDGNEHPLERKLAAILAFLARQGETSRSSLAALLWPDAPRDSRNNLRQALFKLRKMAGREIATGAEVLSLAGDVRCELGAASAGETLLAGCDYADCAEFRAWLEEERRKLAAQEAGELADRAERHERDGELREALEAALGAVRAAPLEESHHRRVMRLHYLRGDRSAALAAFEHCKQLLREALDTVPDSQTRALAASIAEERLPRKPTASAPMPVTLVRPPRLVGREAELARMEAAWSESRAFVLLGEAGIGKSRLIEEFARQRAQTVCAAARPGDASVPYASLARLLRAVVERHPQVLDIPERRHLSRLLPEGGDVLSGETEPRRLQAALGALVRRAAAGGIDGLVLDDLHFADPASLEMVQALAGAELGMRWGFAQRPAEGTDEARALRDVLCEAWKLDAIALAPLDEARMAEFIDSLHIPGVDARRLARELVRLTGGNPLFALETLKSAMHTGVALDVASGVDLPRPASVGALIERRLSRLSPRALALARVAAIAGVDFNAGIAAEVLGETPLALADPWRELEEAHVLHDAAFAHDLIYEATLRGVPAAIARHAHAVVAAALERANGAPERIAEHWIAAAESLRAIPFLKAAAVSAEASARYREARAWLERAIALAIAAGDRRETLELRLLLIELLKEIGDPGEILTLVEAARGEAIGADDRMRLARSEVQARASFGDNPGAKAAASRVLEDEEACAQAHPLRVAEVRYALADLFLVEVDAGRALELLEPMEPLFREHPDTQFRGWFYSDLMRALYMNDRVAEAEALLPLALDLARQVGRKRMISGVLAFASSASAAAGRLNEPLEYIREAQLLIAERDHSSLSRIFHVVVAELLLGQGRFREALAALDTADSIEVPVSASWMARALEVRALAAAQLGLAHEARRHLDAADSIPSVPGLRRARLVNRIEALRLIGAPVDGAVREYEALIDERAPPSARWRARFFVPGPDATAGHFEAIAADASRTGLMGHALAAHVAAARMAASHRDRPRAVANVRAALDLLQRFTLPGAYRPELWLACHEAAREADPALAARALREGAAWVKTVARFRVADEHRAAFLDANRVNRALLEAERAAPITPR